MPMISSEDLRFLDSLPVARMATLMPDGSPHIVPICFTVCQGEVYSALDEKPKSRPGEELRRVRNMVRDPRVTVLADQYADDWEQLAYVMLRGEAELVRPLQSGHRDAVRALREKYPQYRSMSLERSPLLRISPRSVVRWGPAERAVDVAADALGAIRSRRSVRWYKNTPVRPDQLAVILEAGSCAPSPHGRQPWRFVVLEQPDAKRRLADAMAEEWARQLEMDGQTPETVAQRLRRSQDRIRDAPLLVMLCLYLEELDRYPDAARAAAEATMAVQSLGAAAENMLVAARAVGLHGGWMCAPLFCPEAARAVFGLDPALIPQALLTFGEIEREPVRRPRRSLDELVVLRS